MKTAAQIPIDFDIRPAMGVEDFLIGPCNRDAVGWIDRWPEWPAPVLVLHGPAACGKSHLAAVWQEKSKAKTIHLEKVITESADKIANESKHLILDGLDPWLGDLEAEQNLFHLYNIFKEENRSILICMRMAPGRADFALADFASRLKAAPVATIFPPDDMLLASVLIKHFSDRQLRINNDIIKYILPRMERSFAAAKDIVHRTDLLAMSEKRPISRVLVRNVLVSMMDH